MLYDFPGYQLLDSMAVDGDGNICVATLITGCVTVVSPQNEPRAGFVVNETSRRSTAERRLRRTLDLLHEAGIAARGAIVDPDPLQALKDGLEQYQPDEVIISTHPPERSKWLEQGVVDRAEEDLPVPVTHVVVDLEAEGVAADPA